MGVLSSLFGLRSAAAPAPTRALPPGLRAEPTFGHNGPDAPPAGLQPFGPFGAGAVQTRAGYAATSADTMASAPWLFGSVGGFPPSTGVPVTPLSALQSAAVYACVKALSEDIGKIPLVVRRRLRGRGFVQDFDHPLNKLFRQPNRWQTPFEMWVYTVSALALRGNAYVVILRDDAGRPRRLVPINPDRVSVFVSPAGWLYYAVTHPLVGEAVTVHQDDMLHLKNPHAAAGDGAMGLSPIAAAGQEAIGLALATQQHGGILFRQGAQLAGVLSTDKTLSAEAAQRIAASWQSAYAGVQSAHKVAVLEENLKFQPLSMDNEQAQFLATRQFQTIDICRIFRVPPVKIFDMSRATFSNIENLAQDYINDALTPITKQIEQQLEQNLLFEAERDRYLVEFNFDALLRGDTEARYRAYAIGLGHGFRSINEVRVAENLAPIDGGDDFLVQLNMGAVGGGTAPGDLPPEQDASAVPSPADGAGSVSPSDD